MALQHFLRDTYRVRVGGWRLGPWHVGGGWYTVGPLSVVRLVQWLDACAKIGAGAGDADAAWLRALTPGALRAVLPILVLEPIKPAHLRRATVGQALSVLTALHSANDFDYVFKALTPREGESGGGSSMEVLAVSVARELHLGDPEIVLRWPFQKVLATLDALRAANDGLPAGAEPLSESERGSISSLASGLGITVN